MKKKVLIISPYFAPSNAADMQRIRMSLPYYDALGWEAQLMVVDDSYSEMVKDELLLESIPSDIKIHKVKALSKKWTSKVGLGSLGLRSIPYFFSAVNTLIKRERFDLIYFSTTQFPVSILGAYWKKRFKIPYVIDMQDPWHSEYYKNKPKEQQPKKYWFSYRLNKYLEPIALTKTDGLISVSDSYINDLKERYPVIKDIPAATITFGAFERDFEIAEANSNNFQSLLNPDFKNIVYIGRGGMDMHKSIEPVFKSLSDGLKTNPDVYGKLRFYFIGTSYAASDGTPTIKPLAKKYGIEESVIEITNRISYYHTLATIKQADALFIPGSDDPKYSASKIYPYLLTKKPLLAIFHEKSNVVKMLKECTAGANIITFNNDELATTKFLLELLMDWGNGVFKPISLLKGFEAFESKNLTKRQTDLFSDAIQHYKIAHTGAAA